MKNIRITGNKILARRIPVDEKTHGGLFIPAVICQRKEKHASYAEVLAVGPGNKTKKGKLMPTMLKPGDRIIFDEWSHIDVKLQGQELIMTREDDIIGIVE
jgi:chaperonin GroES